MRTRKIVKRGGSYFIKLAPVDLEDFKLVLGDNVSIDDIVKLEKPIK